MRTSSDGISGTNTEVVSARPPTNTRTSNATAASTPATRASSRCPAPIAVSWSQVTVPVIVPAATGPPREEAAPRRIPAGRFALGTRAAGVTVGVGGAGGGPGVALPNEAGEPRIT